MLLQLLSKYYITWEWWRQGENNISYFKHVAYAYDICLEIVLKFSHLILSSAICSLS